MNTDFNEKIYEHKFDKKLMDAMPFIVFVKNLDGKYLWGNKQFLADANLGSVAELQGKQDFAKNFSWCEMSPLLRQNDKTVLELQSSVTFEEITCDPDKRQWKLASKKIPLFSKDDKLSCLLGISLRVALLTDIPTPVEINRLSKREKQCLVAIGTGLTASEAARSLFLSKRTVEHYINNLKIKLNIYSKEKIVEIYNYYKDYLQ